jgi:hypothetical protein
MPPKTLTAEQVAEIDRQQQKPVNWSAVIPQKEDVLTARVSREAARQGAPAMLTAEQTDAAEAQNSVAAETSFGRAMGARPDLSVGPQVPAPKKTLSAAEVDQADYERVGDIAYIPTKDEWKRYGELRQRRDDKVSKFIEAGQAIAGGLVQAAAATAYAPFDFVTRGTKAYDEWVNSSAEGLRQASISTAELYSWAGDMVNDGVQETERVNVIDNQLRQRLAAENKFTGNAQADAQIFAQAREQAMASGAYEKTQEQEASDEDTQYQRFIRDRSLQQQAANITETNIGTLPDGRAEMGIDESKLNQGLVLASALVLDPLNIAVPAGLGAANKVRLLRRVGSLAGKPLKLGSKVAGGAAQKAENLYSGIVEGVESATGIGEAGQAAALSAVSWKAAAAMATLKGSGKLLRRAERGLETGSIIAREIGIGGAGVSRVEAASKLRSAPIPERYRRAYDGFFTSADSTLRRVSETQGLSPIARRSAATLDKLGATQAFRLADDAVSGAAATAPIAVPLAAIAPEERRPEILGSIMTIGAGAGLIGGKLARSAEFEDALVAKMLADADISGGDATSMANMMPHDRLVNMARMQSVISPKADFIPLRAADYEINTTVKEAMGLGTRGIYVDAKKGQRPRIFVNLDKMATGDVAGHEIGHAILKSDILGGEVKRGMRAMVDQQYGTDGVAARGREYVTANLTQEVRDGTTGIQLNVLRPDEVTRIAAAGGDEAAEQALKNEFIRERWANDTDWRKQAIEERADMLNQERLAQGEISWDWARDEIAAETFSGLGKGLNLSGIRASGPLSRAVGAASAGFEAMGARMRGNGRLETPNRLFVENPLFDTPEMRKAVNNYVKTFDRYLVGLEKEGAVKQRGTPIAPTGKAQDAARSPHTRTYSNRDGTVIESDLFIERPDGTRVPKSQQQLDTQERVRAATIKSINDRTKFVNENSDEWGARKFSNGRVEVGGPNLPLQFDHFIQVPEWLRSKAREFEAGRSKGRSYLYSYNAIGTGEVGSYKIKNLGNVEAKTGEMVPFGWAVSTKNHLLAKVIDLNSFRAAAIRAIDNEQLGEFGNDLRAVESGLKQLLSNYENGVAGETGLGVTRKNILNGLLGTGTVVQRASNPVWHTLNNQGSVRTFRFDRLNYADPHGTGYFPHYNKININALPDDAGRMSLDQYGQFDADRKAAWMNKEAVKRGFTNATNWQNADAKAFQAADGQYRQQFPVGGAAQRGSALPDVAVVPERFTGSGDEAGRRSRFVPPPAFFNKFAIASYERGGKFFDASTGDDLTGKTFSSGFIDVSTGKPKLFVDNPSSDIGVGNTYKTNLFKQRAGWKWISDNAPETSTIVSVEGGGRHVYSLRSDFGGGVALARYSDKASEPRLRPTAKGDLVLGQEVGRISIRGKEHPVYDSVRVQSRAPSGQGARGQALPDNEPRTLRDMPQSALKVLHADSDVLPKPAKKLTNATVALTLADIAEKHNGGIITSSNITPEQKLDLMQIGADEAEAALKASGKNAGNWYSTAIQAALGIAGVIYRELSDVVTARKHAVLAKEADPVRAGQFALRLPLAITSQNMTVKLNTRASNEQFKIFLNTGKFDPSIAYGEKAKSISGNLDLANVMIDELGSVLALEDFVSRTFTVRELEAEASKIAGRKITIAGRKDDIVNGAAIFGPKIGQGFLQNLMGKFDPVTIDLWMRRTWGRWTGDVVGDGVTAQRLGRLIEESRKAGRKLPDSIKRLRTTMRSMGETKTGKAKKPELTVSEDVEARLEQDSAFRKDVEAFAKQANAEFQALYRMMSDVMSPALSKKVQEAIARAEKLPDQADAILSDVYRAVIREQTKVKAQLDKGWDSMSLDKKKELNAQRSPEFAKLKGDDRAALIKQSKPIAKGDWLEAQHESAGRTAKLDNPQKNAIKPAWANAAKSIVSELNPIDIPSDMDRRVITEVVNGIREELERRGLSVTNADVQAILWYPEKDLWAKLRGEEESILKQSYDDEFISIAEGLGLGQEARQIAKQIRGY